MHVIGDVRDALCETLEFHGVIKAGDLYPSVRETGADADDEPASFAAAIGELRANPRQTILGFAVFALVMLSIFFGLPLIFG
jgi:hypothetical protein